MENKTFDRYITNCLEEFWQIRLGNNDTSIYKVFYEVSSSYDKEEISNYFSNILELSEQSQDIVYLLLNINLTAIEKRIIKGHKIDKITTTKLLEGISKRYSKPLYADLYWYIFDMDNIDDWFVKTNENEFLESIIHFYQLTSLLLPYEDRFELKDWIVRKYHLEDVNAQKNRQELDAKANQLSVSQKLLIFNSLFEELDIRIGRDISKASFLRFFQLLTNTELGVDYKDTSAKKSLDNLYRRSFTRQKADFNKIQQHLKEVGLLGVLERIEKDIDFEK